MRIISGKFKGKRFDPPKNIPTRPTTDFAKEGLFNIIQNLYNFDNIRFLDLFGGTGSISYELVSRGCTDINLVERFPRCANFIRKTAESMNMPITVHQMDVFDFLKSVNSKFDLIFAGPPYALENIQDIPDIILEKQMLTNEGTFILEHNSNINFNTHINLNNVRNYGTTHFSFFSPI